MTGSLDYGFLARVMELMEIEPEEQLEIIKKVNAVEEFIKENERSKKIPQ